MHHLPGPELLSAVASDALALLKTVEHRQNSSELTPAPNVAQEFTYGPKASAATLYRMRGLWAGLILQLCCRSCKLEQ